MPNTSGKSLTLSNETIKWIDEVRGGNNFSETVESILASVRNEQPDFKRMKFLRELRQSAAILYTECNLPQEAIISFVIEVTGGFKT